MKIVVAVATTGRPGVVGEALLRLSRQARAPDGVLIVGASRADAPANFHMGRFVLSPVKGSSAQRNVALDAIGAGADIVVFIDDDYAPAPGFIAGIERLFSTHPAVVAASGHLIADGVARGGFTFEQADAMIAAYAAPPARAALAERGGRGLRVQHGLPAGRRAASAL